MGIDYIVRKGSIGSDRRSFYCLAYISIVFTGRECVDGSCEKCIHCVNIGARHSCSFEAQFALGVLYTALHALRISDGTLSVA